MITQSEILASLLYFTILYPIIIFTFRGDNSLSKRRCLWTALIFIVAGLAIKLVSQFPFPLLPLLSCLPQMLVINELISLFAMLKMEVDIFR
jgi:hypothetical protein